MKKFSIAVLLITLFVTLPGLIGAMSAFAAEGMATTRLSPEIRTSALLRPSPNAIFSVPALFPASPVPAGDADITQAPRIVVTAKQRVHMIKGDEVRVTGGAGQSGEFFVMRVASRLQDPVTSEYLGRELRPVGRANLTRESAVITEARQEIIDGDLLWPLRSPTPARDRILAALPSSDAFIVSIADGAVCAAQNQVVGINNGARDGMAEGASLALSAASPGRESARMLILRVFERVSYGLITHSVEPVQVGDRAYVVEREE